MNVVKPICIVSMSPKDESEELFFSFYYSKKNLPVVIG